MADPALDGLQRHARHETADADRNRQGAETGRADPELLGGDRQHEGVSDADHPRCDGQGDEHAERRVADRVAGRLHEWPEESGVRTFLPRMRLRRPNHGQHRDRHREQDRRDEEGEGPC